MKITDLKANSKVEQLVVTIEKLEEANKVSGGFECQEGIVSDETGQAQITFWKEDVDRFKQGSKIILNTGWCKEFEGKLKVTAGKFGKIMLVPPEKPE